MKISKEVRVGFVAIIAIAILVWGYNYLKGSNLFYKSTSVYAVYPKVPGLSVSAPIIINGVQSGVVDAIYFHPNKSSSVIVKMSLTEHELMIPSNSVAELISVDFMGSKAIGLKLGNSNSPLKPGDTLRSDFELSMLEDFSEQILPIKDDLETMMDSLKEATTSFKKLMDNFNDIFDKKRKRDMQLAISNLKTTMEKFDVLATDMDYFMKHDLRTTMKKYNNVADSIKNWDINTTLVKAQSTLDTMTLMLNNINKGEGTIGQLMTNDSLYHNLEAVSKDMDLLLIEFREHPKRFVHFSIFGKRDKKKK
jgi:phospholipid/cholesterol/gamma-HCH transport system substrate-binding protein